MRYIKSYNESIFGIFKSKKIGNKIRNLCEEYQIYNYTINEDGSIDVDGDVYLNNESLTKLPLKFGKVTGRFYCSHNQLVSLEGAPKSVGDNFTCADNNLTSLEGCPELVGGDFYCNNNRITTFEHLPLVKDFTCYDNPIFYIWALFRDCDKIEFLNDCDPIREPNIIILDRLNFFLEEIGRPVVTKVVGYECI